MSHRRFLLVVYKVWFNDDTQMTITAGAVYRTFTFEENYAEDPGVTIPDGKEAICNGIDIDFYQIRLTYTCTYNS